MASFVNTCRSGVQQKHACHTEDLHRQVATVCRRRTITITCACLTRSNELVTKALMMIFSSAKIFCKNSHCSTFAIPSPTSPQPQASGCSSFSASYSYSYTPVSTLPSTPGPLPSCRFAFLATALCQSIVDLPPPPPQGSPPQALRGCQMSPGQKLLIPSLVAFFTKDPI